MLTSATLQELEADLEELNALLQDADGIKAKSAINTEIGKVRGLMIQEKHKLGALSAPQPNLSFGGNTPQSEFLSFKESENITDMWWEQQQKNITIYLRLPVTTFLEREKVNVRFGPTSLYIQTSAGSRNFSFTIGRTLGEIKQGECSFRTAGNIIKVRLIKEKNEHWKTLDAEQKLALPGAEDDE
eukprot:TRINITY_DN5648_c0_g3_i1.p1 TRINITY_DN5648_c0_g3~~TRINITY_DN5648_c0_g3_i1.p1  ORF type:complete len:186 (+),score=30.13 TRINITY_DN5648_c0_g3_i1:62-619(+)